MGNKVNETADLEDIEDTYLAPPQGLGVCPSSPRRRHQDRIRCARDLLGKTPVRENGEGARSTIQLGTGLTL